MMNDSNKDGVQEINENKEGKNNTLVSRYNGRNRDRQRDNNSVKNANNITGGAGNNGSNSTNNSANAGNANNGGATRGEQHKNNNNNNKNNFKKRDAAPKKQYSSFKEPHFKNVRKQDETVEDIRADISRIEKEIDLEIKEIMSLRLGM